MRHILTCIALLMIFKTEGANCFFNDGSFKSKLVGKNLKETPFNDYFKDELKGEQMVMFVMYGCEECREATKKAIKLKEAKLIDEVVIFGSEVEEANSKSSFMAEINNTQYGLKSIDYDWSTTPRKFTGSEPNMPPPPLGFYIKDNVIQKVFYNMPDEIGFAKAKDKIIKGKIKGK